MNKDTFLAFYESNADALFGYFLHKVGDRIEARMLTREVFLKMWDYMEPGSSLSDYERDSTLYTLANRTLRNYARKQKERPAFRRVGAFRLA